MPKNGIAGKFLLGSSALKHNDKRSFNVSDKIEKVMGGANLSRNHGTITQWTVWGAEVWPVNKVEGDCSEH